MDQHFIVDFFLDRLDEKQTAAHGKRKPAPIFHFSLKPDGKTFMAIIFVFLPV